MAEKNGKTQAMDSRDLLLWLHMLALSAYFGAQFAMMYMLLPAAEQAGTEQARRSVLIAGFRFYNPFSIAMLGVALLTGAMMLTGIKAELKFEYFSRIWAPLSLKLLLAFFLIFFQTYLTFGLAFRIGRQEEIAAHGDGEPFTVERVNSMLGRIRVITWVTIALTAAIIFISMTSLARAIGPDANLKGRAGSGIFPRTRQYTMRSISRRLHSKAAITGSLLVERRLTNLAHERNRAGQPSISDETDRLAESSNRRA